MREPDGARRGIRAQLNRIVLIPGATFLVLFAMLAAVTLTQAASRYLDYRGGREGVYLVQALTELQAERRLAAEQIADPSDGALSGLRTQAEATDAAIASLEEAGDRLRTSGPAASAFRTELGRLDGLRARVAAGDADLSAALDGYGAVVRHGIGAYDALTRTLHHGPAAAAGSDAVALMRAQELFAEADARLSADPGSRARPTALIGAARLRLDEAAQVLTGRAARTHAELTGSAAWDRTAAPSVEDWRDSADEVGAGMAELSTIRADEAASLARAAAVRMSSLAVGGAALSLFAGAVAYGAASRSAGRLTARLARLRAETLELARTGLPRVVERLERGEQVDPDTAVRPLDHGGDEVGQVADAFNTAQRTAVRAAVRQADMRAGVNRVFLGIAHRNQSLVQRQLRLLDRLEREEEDPDLLDGLFKLDHLATRGRRNAENLVILAGGQPGRRWHDPIPLVDVVRGAISETEEYARIELCGVPDLALSGAVVADVIHLLAELVENATAFSPPHTAVHIRSEAVPKGVAIEVEDRGLGMSAGALDRANATLREAPEFDVMAFDQDLRLGLFVVARLAARHGVRVQLRPSPYGGTRAVVLLPAALIARNEPAPPAAGRPREEPPAAAPAPRDRPRAEEERPRRRQDADDGTGRPALPKRRRQAGLDPRLRAEPAAGEGGAAPPSPEQSRQVMSAFQSGTRRGRRAGDGPPAGEPVPVGEHTGEGSE
ncbi:nitrate- and nitrite sensing domain-containing protein [Nocardiopsis composta]|uniref:histidine kinase n=1 Tax=Nocardiopsis composta TaxID=157465 RepID=A0A7W8VDF1_9ACTN|nr:nitrate- and nitrite sensing domain-containing protein [Nocardiopsis composta]MBB5431933.1 signal transduction histidine kinase [Nocardiopsis composta]